MKAIGPAHIYLLTDIATGKGVKISDMESVSFNPGTQMLGTSNAFTGDAWQADGLYSVAPAPTAELELYDIEIDAIAALVLGGKKFEVDTDATPDGEPDVFAFGFGKPGLTKIDPANVPSLFILPSWDEAAGIQSAFGIWMPAVATESLASIVYNRPTAGGNANSYTCSLKGAQRTTFGGAPLPAEAQFGWFGSPEALGIDTTAWTLPS